MKYKFLLTGLILLVYGCKTSGVKPTDHNTYVETVNPDYGILSITERTRSGLLPLMWRCFPIKDMEVRYRTWPFTDPMDSKKIIETMCDFEIWVNSKPFQNIYHGRRGKPESYCKNFRTAWEKLTKSEEYICMDGETLTKGEPEEDKNNKKMIMSWTWDKIKTKKGCYSFWNGYQCVDF